MVTRFLRRQRGFTLIELMAVIAIMTVLAGLVAGAVTGIGATGQTARLQGDADTLGKAADRFFNDAFPQSYPVLKLEDSDGDGIFTDEALTVAGDLGVRLFDFEAVLPGDPKRAFVPDFLKEVPATAGLVSWRIVTATGETFFAEDGAQLVRPSNNRLDVSAANSNRSIPASTGVSAAPVISNYTFKLRMKRDEAALEILEIQIPAGYSIGGQSVIGDTVMGGLAGQILTDNPWSPGQVLHYSGVLTATGASNEWKLSVNYPAAVNDAAADLKRNDRVFTAAVTGANPTPATDTRHKVSLSTPSLEAAGKIRIEINTNGDKAHNQGTEEWTLTICGRGTGNIVTGGTDSTAPIIVCGAAGSPSVITNPETKAVYRWLAREETSIDVAGTFDTVAGNQSVVIK